MNIKKFISSLLGSLILFSGISCVNVSHAEIFEASYYMRMIEDQVFSSLECEDDMLYLNDPPLHTKQWAWIREIMFPGLNPDVDVRRCIRGKSNTAKFLLIHKKIWPMCAIFLRDSVDGEIKDDFVNSALYTCSPVCRLRWGDKWGITAVLWSVYHRIPCMSHEMGFIVNKSSNYKELIINLENLCLAYYQLAFSTENYRAINFDYLKDTLEFNRLLL